RRTWPPSIAHGSPGFNLPDRSKASCFPILKSLYRAAPGSYALPMANRLAAESSPYLIQHKDNPVDWYPWGEEAFEKARREDKPIFVSIGYAACHWCHVMAHECFENPEIAALMNSLFVNVKVDREERPDVDAVYMNAIHVMGEGGGWPLSAFCDSS